MLSFAMRLVLSNLSDICAKMCVIITKKCSVYFVLNGLECRKLYICKLMCYCSIVIQNNAKRFLKSRPELRPNSCLLTTMTFLSEIINY